MTDNIIRETINELTNSIINGIQPVEPTVDVIQPVEPTVDVIQPVEPIVNVNVIQTVLNPFDFIHNTAKMTLLFKVNDILNINKFPHNKLIFVYSAPKVGSTSIVSSLRIFGTETE